MDLENLQSELLERKFKFWEYFTVSFEFLIKFLKENKKMMITFFAFVFMMIIASSYLKIVDVNNSINYNLGAESEEYGSELLTRLMIFLAIMSYIVIGVTYTVIFLKTVLKIEKKEEKIDAFDVMGIIGKLIMLVGFYILVVIPLSIPFMVIFAISPLLRTPIVILFSILFFSIIPYFYMIYFARHKGIIASLKYSFVLAKGNRLRIIVPMIILSLSNSILVNVIVEFGSYLMDKNFDFNFLIILSTFILETVQSFGYIYALILGNIVFLNVEYCYQKENGNTLYET